MSIERTGHVQPKLRSARAGRWSPLIGGSLGWRDYVSTTLIVAGAAVINEFLNAFSHSNHPNIVYLLSIIICAHLYGARAAYLACTLAFVSYNYFDLAPRFSVSLSSFDDYFALAGYLMVGVVTALMAGRIKAQSDLSRSHAATAQSLFEASREMSATDDESAILGQLVRHLAADGGAAVARSDRGEWREAPRGVRAPDGVMLRLSDDGADGEDAAGEDAAWEVSPLGLDDRRVGAVAWRRTKAEAADEAVDRVNRVLIEVAAAAVARSRLSDIRAEIQTRAQSNRLRDALVSSISHDLRTPLTAILTSATSLRTYGERFSVEVRKDLAQTIAEEAERLDRIVTNILSITKIEADALSVELRPTPLGETAWAARARMGGQADRIRLNIEDERLLIDADPILLDQALVNILQNALRYSPPASLIEMSVWREGDTARLSVADHGPGVQPDEYAQIFDKFYRSPRTSAAVSGSGLGLSIVQGLVQSQRGAAWAGPRADGGTGLVIDLSFPLSGALNP